MRNVICILVFFAVFAIDQTIKYYIVDIAKPQSLNDFVMIYDLPVISIALVFNTGVAFSFLTFLGEWLKFIQVALVVIVFIIVYMQKSFFKKHYLPFAMMLGGGISNICDRFVYGGVVDYIYWHYGFDFPIFNLADVIIDCGIALFALQILTTKNKVKS